MTTALIAPLLEVVVVGALALALIRRFAPILLLAAGLLALAVTLHAVAATTTRTRPDPVSQRYAADSGVFLDGRTDTTCRAAIDARYLADPGVVLFVHDAVIHEVSGRNDRSGTQTGRLSNSAGGARRIPVTTPPPADADRMVSRTLGLVDVLVLETALRYGIPVLTTNTALRRQVTADPDRPATRRYRALTFVDACTGVPVGP